jgi:transposase
MASKDIARELGITLEKAARWRNRFLGGGLAARQKDASRPGRPHTVAAGKVQEIVDKTTQEKPTAATHWSTATMAAALGVSVATVRRIWYAKGLKPHLSRTFKVSKDPQFVDKLEVVAGLCLNPPERALVLWVDEKSQIQALDRTQPDAPEHSAKYSRVKPAICFILSPGSIVTVDRGYTDYAVRPREGQGRLQAHARIQRRA